MSTLVVILLVAAAGALMGGLLPMSSHAPVVLNDSFAALGTALAVAVWWFRHPAWLHVGSLAVVGGVTAIIAVAATPAGAAGVTISYAWVAIYAAFAFPRPVMRGYVTLIAVAMAGALATNPFPGALDVWLLTALTVAVASEVISRLVGRLELAASCDTLTGALNRRGVYDAAARVAGRIGDRHELTVVVVDLDGFKEVNDRHGHAAGDRLLVDLVQAWQPRLRRDDVIGRLGGDEFVLLLPHTSRAAAEAIVSRLRAASPATWSCGYATASGIAPLDTLLRDADRDLYRAKARRARPPLKRATPAPLAAPVRSGPLPA